MQTVLEGMLEDIFNLEMQKLVCNTDLCVLITMISTTQLRAAMRAVQQHGAPASLYALAEVHFWKTRMNSRYGHSTRSWCKKISRDCGLIQDQTAVAN
jgi:hypothetical protein